MMIERFARGRGAWAAVIAAAACVWAFSPAAALAQYGGHGGGRNNNADKPKPDSSDSTPAYKPLPTQAPLTPHGGDYVSTETNYYEIVYMPLQTRIYFYDDKLKPLSARDVHARMTVQMPSENTPRQLPFQYVTMPPGVTEQDYVVAIFDIRPLQNKETSVTIEFSGLADRHYPTASFTPNYSHFAIRPYVAKVLATDADRAGIARQRMCPVAGVPLGSKGPIAKVYIGDYPLYLSGRTALRRSARPRSDSCRLRRAPSRALSSISAKC